MSTTSTAVSGGTASMHVRRSLGRHLAGALTAPVFVLAACGGADSVADPPVSSPPTSSPTQPPKHESPEHFIRRWFDVGTRMQNTGSTDEYLALQKGCAGCEAVAARVERAYAAGGYFKTRGVQSLRASSETRQGTHRIFDLKVNLFPTSYKEESDGAIKHFHGGLAHFQVGLQPKEQSWLVTSFVQVSS